MSSRHFLKLQCEYSIPEAEASAGPCDGEVKFRNAMTAYHYAGPKDSIDDPNRKMVLCECHWEMYRDHWNDMWAQVPRG